MNQITIELSVQKINNSLRLKDTHYMLDIRVIDGDIGHPKNAFSVGDFVPQACICIYSNQGTLDFVTESVEKTLLSTLESGEDPLSFHGLPLMLLFSGDVEDELQLARLREEGKERAGSFQCPFFDITSSSDKAGSSGALVSGSDSQSLESGLSSDNAERYFNESSLKKSFKVLVDTCDRKMKVKNTAKSILSSSSSPLETPDLRILMCFLCGDPFAIDQVIEPFMKQNMCQVTSDISIQMKFPLDDSHLNVEVIFTSYHGAQAFRDELLHGFILVYSTQRKGSLATLAAFSRNIPNTPTQILAVNESISSTFYVNTELSLELIGEGNILADQLQAHFISTTCSQQKISFFTPFIREALERKAQIEAAFDVEESDYSNEAQTPIPPPVPSRQESYALLTGDGNSVDAALHNNKPQNAPLPAARTSIRSRLEEEGDYATVPDADADGDGDADECGDSDEHLIKPSQVKNRGGFEPGTK